MFASSSAHNQDLQRLTPFLDKMVISSIPSAMSPISADSIPQAVPFRAKRYDVIVVGAGHAGCEAARACGRLGLSTAMITMNIDLIAQMSCNPAIGGIA